MIGLDEQINKIFDETEDKSISQAAQLAVNVSYLASSCNKIEDILWKIYKPTGGQPKSPRRRVLTTLLPDGAALPPPTENIIELTGRSRLLTTSQQMQGTIFELVDNKVIDSFVIYIFVWEIE